MSPRPLGRLCGCLALLLAHALSAETLLHKKRLGNNTEGMTYDPSGPYKDHALAVDGNDVFSIALKGTGVKKIFDLTALDPSARTARGIVWVPTLERFLFSAIETYLCGVQYWTGHPGTLLVTACTGALYAVDSQTGAVQNGGLPLLSADGTDDVESIVVRSNGQVLVAGYDTGQLVAYDASLARLPAQDRSFVVGLGASTGRLGWDYDAGELLVLSRNNTHLYGVTANLKTAHTLTALDPALTEAPNPSGIAYLGKGRIAIGNLSFPRGVSVIDVASGASMSRLDFNCCQTDPDPFPPGAGFRVGGVGANGTSTFLLHTPGVTGALRVVTRGGAADTTNYANGVRPLRLDDLPLSAPTHGLDVQLYDAGAGPRIFTGAEIYDGDGQLVHAVDFAALGFPSAPYTGVWIGANRFAVLAEDTSEVAVFSVP